MRVFLNFREAANEITRDLAELGVTERRGYQSKISAEDEKGEVKELVNYDYRVLSPKDNDLTPTQPWADAEWKDRLDGILGYPTNPGLAWIHREDVWRPLLEDDDKFSYTYSERLFHGRAREVVMELARNPRSRQGFVCIWNPTADPRMMGKRRVPCSLGYDLQVRSGALELTYYMRSSDFKTHWNNDCYLALRFQQWAANRIGVPVGQFTHCIKNLHIYSSEVIGVF